MAAGPLIRLENVRFAYPGGAFAMRVESFTIDTRERVAIIGPSGSGKSTLLHLITGVLTPASGRILLGGEDIGAMTDKRRRTLRRTRLGLIFQELELLEYLSARENILLPHFLAGSVPAAAAARVSTLTAATGISEALGRAPGRLSQGERQRVALCRALVTEPELLVCDEPTGSLDPASAAIAVELLLDQASRHGATVLLVTHDHKLLASFDRVVNIDQILTPDDGAAL